MGPIILALIITWAFKHAWDHSRGDFSKSKAAHRQKQPAKQKRAAEIVHHDIGYWTHQGTHAFPAFRHGFGKGWHDARQKAATQQAARAQAKAEHLETRASLAPQIAEARTRQQAAHRKIRSWRLPRLLVAGPNDINGECRYCHAPDGEECDPDCPYLNQDRREMDRINAERAAQAEEEGSWEGSPEVQPEAGPDAREDQDDPASPTYSYGPEAATSGWPADGDAAKAHSWARMMGTREKPWVVTEYPPGGGPGKTVATYPDAGQQPEGRGTEDEPSRETAGDGPATQGDSMPAAADTTYDGVLSSMAAAKNVAEGNAAEAQTASRNADNLADQMQALEVDPATLSAMADHQAAHDGVTKAYQRLLESAENVVATLKRGHKDLAEAHQNAPVEAAEKQFYAA